MWKTNEFSNISEREHFLLSDLTDIGYLIMKVSDTYRVVLEMFEAFWKSTLMAVIQVEVEIVVMNAKTKYTCMSILNRNIYSMF